MSGPGYAPPPQGAPHFEAPGAPGARGRPPGPPSPVAAPVASSGGPAFVGYPPIGPSMPPLMPPSADPRFARPAGPPQRPAVIALGCTLAVLGSLQWICVLSLFWVTASVGIGAFAEVNDNGAVFHILNRFNYRMLDGLAVPLFLFPVASLATGFLVLSRRPWTRLVHTGVGAAALVWAGWWLRDDLLWWFIAAWYIAVACLVLWTPAATAWYRWSGGEPNRTPGA